MSGADLPGGCIHPSLSGTDDTLVSKMRWNQLAGERAIVGRCRVCSGNLQAVPPGEHDAQGETGEVTWYEARCLACGKEYAAPDGRIMRRSSAHRETPRGWLDQRERRDKEDSRSHRPS